MHSYKALGRQAVWRHLDLPGLAQCKPKLVHWACSGQAQAALGRVYPTPKTILVFSGERRFLDRESVGRPL